LYVLADHNYFAFSLPIEPSHILVIEGSGKLTFDYLKSYLTLSKLKADVIIYPKNFIPLSHFLLPGRKINIIHDLAFFMTSFKSHSKVFAWLRQRAIKASCRWADHVVAVSEHTRKEIVRLLEVDRKKVTVCHEAVTLDSVKPSGLLDDSEPYFFCPTTMSPRKNIVRIIDAFEQTQSKTGHKLYIAGHFEVKKSHLIQRIAKNPNIKVLGYVTEGDMVAMYQHATALLYPSLYEGFGLPLLEAQLLGCAVITSRMSSCPEVAGKGAHYIDPYNTQELMDAMLLVSRDASYRNKLTHLGSENIKRFDWRTTADIIERVIHSFKAKK
jgi:glycosyltransferase involved in cell wall biosynthesis